MANEHLRGRVIRELYKEYMARKYGEGYEDLEFTAIDIMHAICTSVAALMDSLERAVEFNEIASCLNELRDEGDAVRKAIDEMEFGNFENN